ncbi:coiled-coil domain-containing protein [Nocardiopsis metallicus]|uniref:BMFP domain-containing protein YqiC n=1 Tax=Nocardiopsis metallicus TaxID=179819 RepID=A0A840WIX6_9ACTN|nr:membrane fusogenic activity family protein [Nocardiopsis metallicus]MBB5491637.1 BMFP domain-containing protein YqiC [Nocardiopsis metallicus]
MVVDAVRTYLDAANGLTELSRKQAVAAAKTLIRANGAAAPAEGEAPPRVGQSIQALAGELIETSQANRAAVADLVRAEVRSALEQMDMVPRAEYERVVRRVAELERRMAARQTVERVLAPRGGASSVLPAREEGRGPAAQEVAPEVEEPVESERAVTALRSDDARSSESGEHSGGGEGGEAGQTALSGGEDTSSADIPDAPDTSEEGAEGGADTADADGTGDEADPQAAAKRTAPTRGKAKTGAKSTRARSTAKRTTKGKGAKK